MTFIVVGLFIGGSMVNRLRLTSTLQRNGAVTMGTVVRIYERFFAIPFVEYQYVVGRSPYEKEAALLGVPDADIPPPGTPIRVSYVPDRPRTALPTLRVGMTQREMEASIFCGATPLVLGLLMLLVVELTRGARAGQ